jgi:hypothetical protein
LRQPEGAAVARFKRPAREDVERAYDAAPSFSVSRPVTSA